MRAQHPHARTLHKPQERARFTARLKFFQLGAPFCLAAAFGPEHLAFRGHLANSWAKVLAPYFEAIWPAVGLQLLQFDVPFCLAAAFEVEKLQLSGYSASSLGPLGLKIWQFQAIWPAVRLWCSFLLCWGLWAGYFCNLRPKA